MARTEPPLRGERELLCAIGRELMQSSAAGALPFGDDMAALDPADPSLLWSTDLLSEGVDFDSGRHAWADIGWKAMAVNLSDCAAMAVRPVAALCAVCLNDRLSTEEALELLRGIVECGRAYGCPLVGGDTNSWRHPTVVCLTVAGRAEPGVALVRRSGARAGDLLYLTGRVGGSILGRHLRPQPRIDAALEIARTLRPSAMIDISDGLGIDLWHICEQSGVGAELDETLLAAAIHPDAFALSQKSGRLPQEHALEDGEDFELIVAAPRPADPELAGRLGLLPLGRIVAEPRLALRAADGTVRVIEPRGYEHFR